MTDYLKTDVDENGVFVKENKVAILNVRKLVENLKLPTDSK